MPFREFVRRTWILYVVFLPLPVVYLASAGRMDPRSVMLPRLVSIAILVGIVVITGAVLRDLRGEPDRPFAAGAFLRRWHKTIGLIALVAAFVALLHDVGFYITAAVMLYASFALLQVEGQSKRVLLVLGSLAGSYLLFERVLDVALP